MCHRYTDDGAIGFIQLCNVLQPFKKSIANVIITIAGTPTQEQDQAAGSVATCGQQAVGSCIVWTAFGAKITAFWFGM